MGLWRRGEVNGQGSTRLRQRVIMFRGFPYNCDVTDISLHDCDRYFLEILIDICAQL